MTKRVFVFLGPFLKRLFLPNPSKQHFVILIMGQITFEWVAFTAWQERHLLIQDLPIASSGKSDKPKNACSTKVMVQSGMDDIF
jgi:hypothetical protein